MRFPFLFFLIFLFFYPTYGKPIAAVVVVQIRTHFSAYKTVSPNVFLIMMIQNTFLEPQMIAMNTIKLGNKNLI